MYFGGANGLRELALSKQEVIDTALSFRGDGHVGPFSAEILAVEPDKIADVAWFRNDFSESSLNELMQNIGPAPECGKIELPEGTHSIGLWIKPRPFKASFEVLAQVENQQGNIDTVFFNTLRSDDWHYLQGEIDEDFDEISAAIKGYLGEKFVSVLEMRCMTYDQTLKLNYELGH